MKTSRNQQNRQSKQGQTQKPRPEIRDDLDSRERKEKTKVSSSRVEGKKNRKDQE